MRAQLRGSERSRRPGGIQRRGPDHRSEVLARAQYWVDQDVVYGTTFDSDGNVISTESALDSAGRPYRTDCSGFVSMAWHLSASYTTSNFHNGVANVVHLSSASQLQPGDAVLFSGHIEMFAAWKNANDHTEGAWAYSLNGPVHQDWAKGPFYNSHGQRGELSWSDITNNILLYYNNIINDVAAGAIPTGTLADINLDGKKDVLAQNGTGTLIVYPGSGTGGFGTPYTVGTGFTDANSIAVADLTSDGRPDLLVRFASSGDLKLFAHTGNASQPYTGNGTLFGTGWNGWTINAADLNLDGKADILAVAADGSMYVYPGNGAGGLGARYLVGTGFGGWNISVADVTLDGKPDIAARNAAGEIKLFAHSGNIDQPFTGSGTTIGTGFSTMNAIVFGDFNDDGKPDLITRVTSTAKLVMYPHNGTISNPYAGTPIDIGTGWGGMIDID